jgi:class 3 adenylate cyclase
MALSSELTDEVGKIFRERWTERDGTVVPTSKDLGLGNDAVKLEGVVLYADLSESTALVDSNTPTFAAEVYKTSLHCAARIVRAEGGEITAFDGDRIMAVFIGDTKNTSAARAGLKLNYARLQIINPALKEVYSNSTYELKHVVGIDRSSLYVARTGIRGANDLVWVGSAANHAAKLSALTSDYPTRITKDVYDCLRAEVKSSRGQDMWKAATWNGRDIYRSTWMWEP